MILLRAGSTRKAASQPSRRAGSRDRQGRNRCRGLAPRTPSRSVYPRPDTSHRRDRHQKAAPLESVSGSEFMPVTQANETPIGKHGRLEGPGVIVCSASLWLPRRA
jgi:hypothetical protein